MYHLERWDGATPMYWLYWFIMAPWNKSPHFGRFLHHIPSPRCKYTNIPSCKLTVRPWKSTILMVWKPGKVGIFMGELLVSGRVYQLQSTNWIDQIFTHLAVLDWRIWVVCTSVWDLMLNSGHLRNVPMPLMAPLRRKLMWDVKEENASVTPFGRGTTLLRGLTNHGY